MFYPEQIPGCVLAIDFARGSMYQDSAKTTAVTATNQPIGFAPDWSGGGSDAIQTVAGSRPTYKAAGVNGFPVAQAATAGPFLSITPSRALKTLDNGSPCTIMFVFANTLSTAYSTILSKGNYDGSRYTFLSYYQAYVTTFPHQFISHSVLAESDFSMGGGASFCATYTYQPRLAGAITGRETFYECGRIGNYWEDVVFGVDTGAPWRLFTDASGNFSMQGEISMVYVWNRVLSPVELEQAHSYAGQFVPTMQGVDSAKRLHRFPQARVVVSGNSLDRGLNANGYSWSQQLEADQTMPQFDWCNLSISGQQVAQMAAVQANSKTLFANREAQYIVRGMPTIVYIGDATNDIDGGASAASIVTNTKTLAGVARAQGAKVIVVSSIARTWAGDASTQSAKEAVRQSVRQMFASDNSWYDQFVDLAADSRIGVAGVQTGPLFSGDGTHLNGDGQAVKGALLRPAILSSNQSAQPAYGSSTTGAGGGINVYSLGIGVG